MHGSASTTGTKAKAALGAIGAQGCLNELVEKGRSSQSRKNRVSPGQQKLPFAFDIRLNQIPEDWHQVAVRFRSSNGIRDGDQIVKLL